MENQRKKLESRNFFKKKETGNLQKKKILQWKNYAKIFCEKKTQNLGAPPPRSRWPAPPPPRRRAAPPRRIQGGGSGSGGAGGARGGAAAAVCLPPPPDPVAGWLGKTAASRIGPGGAAAKSCWTSCLAA